MFYLYSQRFSWHTAHALWVFLNEWKKRGRKGGRDGKGRKKQWGEMQTQGGEMGERKSFLTFQGSYLGWCKLPAPALNISPKVSLTQCSKPDRLRMLGFYHVLAERFGEGNGTPLQYSCLENGVAKSRARLSDFTFTFHFHALEKEMATHSSVLAWRIPGTGEPCGLPCMGSHRVGHDWSDLAAAERSLRKSCIFLKPKIPHL